MNLKSSITEEFPHNKIYLNNASVSLVPLSSIKKMNDFLLEYNKTGPDSLESDNLITKKISNVRNTISKLINCDPEEVVITQSTTDGINIVANGLAIEPTSNIILRGMEHEHHANYYPWLRLSKKLTIKNLKVDQTGFFEIKELQTEVDKNTKAVVLSHALYNTGAILPVEEVGRILEKTNTPYFIDAAQTVGCIENIDVKDIKCDFMSFNGSKWLCGPMGTGIFYCKKSSSNLLEPTSIGGESAMIYNRTNLAYKDLPDKFQTGFRNYVGMAGMESSVKLLMSFGLQNIRQIVIKLANLMREELAKIPKITLYGPNDDKKRTSIVSFTIDKQEPQYVVEKLEKQKIILAVREIYDKKIIRASPHFFNTETEILKTVEAIKRL